MENKKQMELLLDQFDSFGYYLDQKLDRDIEENRKGQFCLHFRDQDGNILENVHVKVKQVSHEFLFGANLLYLDQFEDEERRQLYRQSFASLFNHAVLPFYWNALEPQRQQFRFEADSPFVYRRPPIDPMVQFCRENGITMKAHPLVCKSFNPDWLPEDSRVLKMETERKLRAIAERYPNDFVNMDVLNEMNHIYKNCYKGNGVWNYILTDEEDHEKWAYDLCRKYFPHTRLFWNEGMHTAFGKDYAGFRSFFYLILKQWIDRGAPIGGIGMQYHMFAPREHVFEQLKETTHPLRLIDVADCYGSLGRPIHISEVSIPSYGNDPDDEQLQAELTKRLYKLWFGRKQNRAIIWWNLADLTALGGENKYYAGLIRNDCTPKPVYHVLDELIHKTWHTELESSVNGRLNFAGFYGEYEVEAECDGRKTVQRVRLHQENSGFDNRRLDFRGITITL